MTCRSGLTTTFDSSMYSRTGKLPGPNWLQIEIAAYVAIALNVVIILILAELGVLRTIPETKQPPARSDSIVLKIDSSSLNFEPPEPEPTEPELAMAELKAKQEFLRQFAPDEGRKQENAPFYSDRDVSAASEAAPDEDAPPLPAQEGIEDLPAPQFENLQYTDGPSPRPAPPGQPVTPVPPGADPTEPAEETERAEEVEEPQEEQNAPSPLEPEEKESVPEELMRPEIEEERLPAVPDPEPEREEPEEDLLALLERTPSFPEAVPQSQPERDPSAAREQDEVPQEEATPEQVDAQELLRRQGERVQAPGASPGYQPERRRTMIRGSVSSRGRAQAATENTPLGRFEAEVADAIGRVWYRNTKANSDKFRIGTTRLRFDVLTTGAVTNVEVVSNTSNELFVNNNLRSLNQANIPEIPDDLRAQVGGRVTIEFSFTVY